MSKLTYKELLFRDYLLKGKTQREAYQIVYDAKNMSLAAIDVEASRLANNPKISLSLQELRKPVEDNLVADLQERKRILSEIARGKTSQFVDDSGVIDQKKLDSHAIQSVGEQQIPGRKGRVTKLRLHNPMAAIDQLNKLEGSYAPEQHEVRHAIINVHIHAWEEGRPFKRVTTKEEPDAI